MTIRIVTDSSAGLPADLCKRLGIAVIPVYVQFGAHTLTDAEEGRAEFYDWLTKSEQPPQTATPSPVAFAETYRRLQADGATAIISIHMMETKSALVNVARMAAQMVPDCNVQVVDSHSATLGVGLIALLAAEAVQAGRSVAEILALLEEKRPTVHVHGAIRQMTQLRRSGRVSLSQALLAGVLAIKPIIYLGQNLVEVVAKARGWEQALARLTELALAQAGAGKVRLVILHTNCEAEAHTFLEQVRSRFAAVEILVADAGSALASHAGPGAIGIATMQMD